jgi:hypothetical protein
MVSGTMVAVNEHARALNRALAAALPGWVERCVERTLVAARGQADPSVMREAAEAGRRAQADVVPRLEQLLGADIDEQPTTPLALVRQAVAYPTEVLRRAGIPPVERDAQQRRLFPDDIYDLAPASFADVDTSVADLGLAWGAAKAYAHLQRHGRPAGERRA